MDVTMLYHSISNILQWKKSLKPLANRLTGIDINQIETILIEINEKVQKQSNYYSKEWLQKVKDVVIDFNDLMEDLRQKEGTGGLNLNDRFKATVQVKKATGELKLLLLNDKEAAKGEETPTANTAAAADDDIRKSAYEVFDKSIKSAVFGRENEKKEFIDQLLKPNNSDAVPAVVIVAIFGVPGIGKTKLANLVCKDDRVKAHFGFQPTWINHLQILNETFDVKSIVKRVTTTDSKRLLLVIDDLRVEIEHGHLEKMQKKLKEVIGCTDITMLVTTRSNHVANSIAAAAGGHVLNLQGLNQEESRSLFQCVNEPNTVEPEPKILKDCSGVPLLILMIATLIKNRGGESTMQEVAAATLTEEDVERKFLPELEFFYYGNLPTHQKLCFAYCSLFAEDYLIDADRLIQLWSAEGFLTIHSDKIPEQQFGRSCFNYFVPLVFHQGEEENKYRMNPLMHKLAKLVATNYDENVIVDSMGERVRSGMLRALFDYPIDLLCGIPDSMFDQAKKLRTILLPYNSNNPRLPHEVRMTTSTCDKIFNTFISLRVLDMHDLGIKTVPGSIEEVKYLRFLDLSNNNIEKLPSCITNLTHLETLKLSQCHVLKELPKDIEDLSCLNHLDIEGCLDLTYMPTGINKITSLQTLSLFVASKKQVMGGLRELTDLNNLRGHLEISHLEQVKLSPSKDTAKDVFLKNKQHLELLTLRWEQEENEMEKEKEKKKEKESTVNRDKDKNLLDYLEPNEHLKVLFVVGYNGKTLSSWFASLHYLVKFTLNNCPKCQYLPSLDGLRLLKVLQLRRLNSLEFISKDSNQPEEGSSPSTPTFFSSLKELTISDCPNLKSWWENNTIQVKDRPYFRCISKLNVQYCPKLACLPLYPGLDEELVLVDSKAKSIKHTIVHQHPESIIPFSKLKLMVIERIEHSPPEAWIANFTSLRQLHIRDCSTLKSLPQGFKSLSSLKTLTIERCQQLDLDISKDEWKGLKSLHSLTLRTIPQLKSLPEGLENVNSLEVLRLYDCSGLTSLSENIGNLTSLSKLVLSECRSLESLPKGMEKLKSLQTLIIRDCPFLLPRSQPETGDDWPQIAHIPEILKKQTPHDSRDL
ncbi:putative disease resistance protein RGA4 [Trifolium pratense]|uniref:putative disease resistance protein RGA4 n=1 Tax=Trifolium pratense TaxID=57577 RepID=UPI001E693EE1|nr:putative disease resistance protein RGA4 [Trifolium pratense]